jgi:hypothetical protein
MSRYSIPKLETKGGLVEITKTVPAMGSGDPAHIGNPNFRVLTVGSVGFNL